jgi:hypothetical protein
VSLSCRPAPTPAEAPGNGAFRFTDVTRAAGLGAFEHVTGAAGDLWFPETMGAGGGFLDYDGDGWQDLLLVRGATWPGRGDPVPALALYRNNGDGTFTEQTSQAGLGTLHTYGFGLTIADYDNDGDADFFLTTLAQNRLYRNDGGHFVEVGQVAGVSGPAEWSSSALFVDADRDGWLDLFVGNYVDWSPEKDQPCLLQGNLRSYCTPELYTGLPPRFYRNNGDGTFTERTTHAGFLPAPGKTLAVAHLDYNSDGWQDLVAANDTERNLLYHNNGDGTFTEKGTLTGIAFDQNGKARAGMGLAVGVVDSTGQPTVFVANFSREMIGVYQYTPQGVFFDRAMVSRIGQPSLNDLTFGLILFDADLDGYPDLLTANGHITPQVEQVDEGIAYRQPARLFHNQGDGTFAVVEPTGADDVWAMPLLARGAACADYDHDGDLDVLLTENGGPAHLWRNDLPPTSHLRIRLEGQASNRDAIGARLVATVGTRRLVQHVQTGASYLSHTETIVTFGLGAAPMVDSLQIFWPNGVVETFTEVAANQYLHLREGTGQLRVDAVSSPPSASHLQAP